MLNISRYKGNQTKKFGQLMECNIWNNCLEERSVKGSYDFTTVSMSVVSVFSKTPHRTFLKLLMKLGCLKGKIWRSRIFGKNLILRIMPKSNPKIVHWCANVLTFIILLKPHVREKYGSRVRCKNALCKSDCRIFKL